MSAPWLAIGLQAAIAALCLHAAWTDVRERRIANRDSLAIGALAAALAALEQQLLGSVIAGGALLLAGMLAWRAGLAGGGDVKLLAAAAVWAGPDGLVPLLLGMGLAGGVLAVAAVLRSAPTVALASPAMLLASARNAGTVPYGVAIAAGAVWVWLVDHLA